MSKIIKLENSDLQVEISTSGAEVRSIVRKYDGREYIWNAAPEFWKRSAPVLFPLVGNFKDKKYRYQGREYQMGQHGFARDMEFDVLSEVENYAELVLYSNEETKENYPFDFELHISYLLEDNRLSTNWTVVNSGDKEMYFSIGGHPAFMIPKNKDGEQSVDNGSSLLIDDADVLNYKLIDENGLAVDDIKRIDLDNGYLPLSMDLFEKDALIVEKSGIRSVTLCNYEKVASLSVEFHTPVFGLWAPAGKESPFVCIEPWYGRCDGADFKGELCDREYGNKLPEGAEFSGGYDIIVEM